MALSEYLNFTVTSDEDESDDEILEFKDDGIDYAKLWDEQSTKPKSAELQDIKMDNSLLEELKFFTLKNTLALYTWLTLLRGDTSTACLLTVPARPIRVESSRGPELMIALTST